MTTIILLVTIRQSAGRTWQLQGAKVNDAARRRVILLFYVVQNTFVAVTLMLLLSLIPLAVYLSLTDGRSFTSSLFAAFGTGMFLHGVFKWSTAPRLSRSYARKTPLWAQELIYDTTLWRWLHAMQVGTGAIIFLLSSVSVDIPVLFEPKGV